MSVPQVHVGAPSRRRCGVPQPTDGDWRSPWSEETKSFVLPVLEVLASVLDQERDRCRRLLLSFETGFVGNSATHEVHAAGCAFIGMINAGHLVHFETLAEAFAAGYDGCGHCLPE